MRFELDDDQALLRDSIRELLAGEAPLEASRRVMEGPGPGYATDLFAQLGQLGYLGLIVPEEAGGMGLSTVELAAVLEEIGRVALPGPYLELVCTAEILRHCPGHEAASWLRRLISGHTLVVLADREHLGPGKGGEPETRLDPDAGRVVGRKCFVPFGEAAHALLVVTRQGLALVQRPEGGWPSIPMQTIDPAQRYAEISLDAPGTLLLDPAEWCEIEARADRLAGLGAAALLLGLAQSGLERTVAYLKERKAFGGPIGRFQVLQHRAADMLIQTENARAAVYRAAWAFTHAPDEAPLAVAAAKAYTGEAARFVTREAIHVFGGVGFTWEYDLHIYYKRVKTLEQFFGSTRDQIERAFEARCAQMTG